MSWRRTAFVAGGVVVTVIVVGALAGMGRYVAGGWPLSQPAAKVAMSLPNGPPLPSWNPAEPVLAQAGSNGSGDQDVPDALESAASVSGLGEHVGAAVVELDSGTTIYESNADAAFIPASTMKILTCAAALQVLGPEHRFTTAVVAPDPLVAAEEVEITLVGGGDPMLVSTSDDATTAASGTRLDELAAASAAALAEAGTTSVRLTFDDSLFTGPAIDPQWKSSYVPDDVVAPVSALSVDGGRLTPGLRERADDPARAAVELFAESLREHEIAVADTAPERVTAASGSAELASISSAPLSRIVEHVIATSDNDAAETLARQVAVGSGRPGTSNDASAAVTDAVAGLGVDLADARIRDGSGLSRENALTVSSIASVLTLAANPDHPDLRPIITGLPVAGFSGTLVERAADGGAGYVRAKTGTLTGVHGLAGLALSTGKGAGYVFAIVADDADDALGARAALDEFAAVLATSR